MRMYNFIRHFVDYLKLRKAINLADEQHQKDGDRYYVLPSMDGKLVVTDRKNFRLLKRKHYIPADVTLNQIRRECFYHTPYANGTDRMPAVIRKQRAENYYMWITSYRKYHGKSKEKA